jgi:hypothetical protein
METFVDLSVLATLAWAAFVLAKFWGIVTERLPFWGRLSELGREIGGYVIIVLNGVLFWILGLNALPGFGAAGLVITCVMGALGPSAFWDALYDPPVTISIEAPPEEPPKG